MQRTGVPADLDEAGRLFRNALKMAPAYPRSASVLSDPAGVLNDRFSLTGDFADLAEAVKAARAAVAAISPSDLLTAARLVNLAVTSRCRFEQTGKLADLTEAIAAFRIAGRRGCGRRSELTQHPTAAYRKCLLY